jgi:hypothetical protein
MITKNYEINFTMSDRSTAACVDNRMDGTTLKRAELRIAASRGMELSYF